MGMILKKRLMKKSLSEKVLYVAIDLKSCAAIRYPLNTKNKSTPLHPNLVSVFVHSGCGKNLP
jgi:hypothetical protein